MRLIIAFILVFISFTVRAQYMGEPENHFEYVQTRLIIEEFVHIEYDTSEFMEVGVGFSTYNYFHTVYNYFDYQKYPDSLSRLFLIKNTRVINAKLYVHGGEYYIDSDWWPTKKESNDFLRIFMTQYLSEQKAYTPIPMMQEFKIIVKPKIY